ncbi:hypothetical protein [Alteromonas sp. ASW11-130]|uniref:hypothetical protein n=1 Tax=Alteromonas sp. ASW11-130 TaxID=3015775 RepID=UPI00224202E3|nr:hypothetical protein [Alteromonas sp. ASW11-130]MCW8091500.1 hypothetical protein [Alteromonas sp. ASW11-130]
MSKVIMNYSLCCLLFLITCCFSAANANQSNDEKAFKALEQALNDLQRCNRQLPSDYVLSYSKQEQNKEGDYSITRVHRRNKEQIDAVLIESEGDIDQNRSINWNGFVLVTLPLQTIHDAIFVRENDTSWKYKIPSPVQAQTDTQVDLSHANEKLNQQLVTEVTVRKDMPIFTSMRIFAPHPFSPSLLAKVTKFDVGLDFNEVSDSGPLYVAKETRQLTGRYGLLISFDEWVETTQYDVKIVQYR